MCSRVSGLTVGTSGIVFQLLGAFDLLPVPLALALRLQSRACQNHASRILPRLEWNVALQAQRQHVGVIPDARALASFGVVAHAARMPGTLLAAMPAPRAAPAAHTFHLLVENRIMVHCTLIPRSLVTLFFLW